LNNKLPSTFSSIKATLPTLGIGLGLRGSLIDSIMAHQEKIDWLEFTPENYFQSATGGQDLLKRMSRQFALTSHGVSMSIGSADALDQNYLAHLKHLVEITDSPWFSDHLSFSSVDNHYIHDLFPLPQNIQAAQHVADKIQAAQAFVGKPMLIENISAYQKMEGPLSEAQFLTEVAILADCGILLDLNNLYINSINLKFDPYQYLAEIPLDRVVQVHMAGHLHTSKYLVDTHGERVEKNVFALLEHLLTLVEVKAITLERDQNFADFKELMFDLDRIRDIHNSRKTLVSREKERETNKDKRHTDSTVSLVSTAEETDLIDCTPTGAGVEALREFEKAFIGNLLERTTGSSPFIVEREALSSADINNLQLSENASEIYLMITNSRLEELLQSVYPCTFVALGESSEKVSAGFYRKHPTIGLSQETSTKDFAEYLNSDWSEVIMELPYLCELALSEHKKRFCGQYNTDSNLIDLELDSFEQLSQSQPVLNQSLELFTSAYPIPSIVRATESLANVAAEEVFMPWGNSASGISGPYNIAIYRPTGGASAQLLTVPVAAAALIKAAALTRQSADTSTNYKHFSCLNLIEEAMSSMQITPSAENLANLIGLVKQLFELGIFAGCKRLNAS
jgi:hypothetical protein